MNKILLATIVISILGNINSMLEALYKLYIDGK